MLECNRLGFAISTGSACATGQKSASKTMVAMEVPEKIGKEFIRISFGQDTTEQDVTRFRTSACKDHSACRVMEI